MATGLGDREIIGTRPRVVGAACGTAAVRLGERRELADSAHFRARPGRAPPSPPQRRRAWRQVPGRGIRRAAGVAGGVCAAAAAFPASRFAPLVPLSRRLQTPTPRASPSRPRAAPRRSPPRPATPAPGRLQCAFRRSAAGSSLSRRAGSGAGELALRALDDGLPRVGDLGVAQAPLLVEPAGASSRAAWAAAAAATRPWSSPRPRAPRAPPRCAPRRRARPSPAGAGRQPRAARGRRARAPSPRGPWPSPRPASNRWASWALASFSAARAASATSARAASAATCFGHVAPAASAAPASGALQTRRLLRVLALQGFGFQSRLGARDP